MKTTPRKRANAARYYQRHRDKIRAKAKAKLELFRAAHPIIRKTAEEKAADQKAGHARWIAAYIERRREISRLSARRRKAEKKAV